ncbi:MAG: outer membrane protein assembly factor BamA [Candidatus Omnitrophica bacterium]|nr:outer membrane protein assembly factor BamA [Candidatus Omnitrophota bacterium]
MIRRAFLFSLLFCFTLTAYSQENISRIDIEGNAIVSDATIISKIKVRAGLPYNENIINEDVKNLYATGFFEIVEAEKKDSLEGMVILFKVDEKPLLKKITIEGMRFIRKVKIIESIDIKEGSFVDEYKVKEAVRKIKDLYNIKGFSQAEVNYEIVPVGDENEVAVKLSINEKGILKVRKVEVLGNKVISVRRIIKLMKSKKAWLFNRGVFKKKVLEDDLRRITDFYKLEGFSDAVVKIDVERLPKGIHLIVNIDEGQRYYVGKITIEGVKEISEDVVNSAMKLENGSVYSEQAVYLDSSLIREAYVDRGYIFSQIEPLSLLNPATGKIDIAYKINENNIAYIEDINIKGNIKTKDKIIRRELRVYPGERFDGKRIRKSKERLDNLGFFEEIRFGTEPGSEPDNVDLVVDVKEAKTGYFSFGGGYSSIDEFMGFVEVRQRNFDYRNFSTFTGAGQDLSIMLSMGTLTKRYQLSFTNPWIFDKPVSFGFDGYRKGHDQDDNVGYAYKEDVKGGLLRLGREFNDYWKGGVAYRFENVEISDVVSGATTELLDEVGSNDLSSGEAQISYDSRDSIHSPSKGIYASNTLQVFGGPFLGDKDFIKYFGRVSFYTPAVNESVIELRLRGGIASEFSDTNKIPIYERFFAGGASTVRGYRERKVGPIDRVTEDPLGGDRMLIGNIEYTYPLANFLKAATFFDIGKVWGNDSANIIENGFMSSIGLGLRVNTPIGPVSVDYGWPLDTEVGEEDQEGRFHFNVSRAF